MLNHQAHASTQLDSRRRRRGSHQRYERVSHVIVGPRERVTARIGGLVAGRDMGVLADPERLKAALFTGVRQFIGARAVFHIVAEDAEMHGTVLHVLKGTDADARPYRPLY